MNKTWLLFEDGTKYSLSCRTSQMPRGSTRPSDAYVLTEHSRDFLYAAQRAVDRVHHYCVEAGMKPGNVTVGFDLSERVGYDGAVTGRSCGLSFAATFARELIDRELPTIAATGEICPDGRIGKVKGIEAKIKTAEYLLKEGDLLFIPKDNLEDISKDRLDRISQKKIKWFAVSDVDEFMDILFEKKKRHRKKAMWLILFFVLLIFVTAIALLNQKNLFQSSSEEKSHPELVMPPGEETTPPKKVFE